MSNAEATMEQHVSHSLAFSYVSPKIHMEK